MPALRHRAAVSLLTAILAGLLRAGPAGAAEWTVPFGGNAFVVAAAPDSGDGLARGGAAVRWRDPATVYAVFFHVDRPARVELHLRGFASRTPLTATVGAVTGDGRVTRDGHATDEGLALGVFDMRAAGYVRVECRRRDDATVDVVVGRPELVVRSDTEGLTVAAIRDDRDGMFYWGRRGPSVHLGYDVPRGIDVEYAYSEITVPVGEDPIGSYFMANGFGEGYFGIQVNGPDERRVLFSVWSPQATDDPATIPPDARVGTLAAGPGVRVGAFGGEGSGGQSILVFPWRAGVTYRFLTRVAPDGAGSTDYASWFAEGAAATGGEWRLIARFRRPRTDTHLTGFHSFLENFADTHGHHGRRARYANPWVRDTAGRWHAVTAARFTGDATARGGHRLDYAGGVDDGAFVLRNGGFFAERVPLDTVLELPRANPRPPAIDLDRLP